MTRRMYGSMALTLSASSCQVASQVERRRSEDVQARLEGLERILRRVAVRLCRNESEADDLVQDTFERVLQAFDFERNDRCLRAWSTTVMRNLFIDRLRRNQRGRDASSVPDVSLLPTESEPEWSSFGAADLRAAVASLDKDFRDVFELHSFHGMKYADIAKHLRIKQATVGTRLARAREKLRKLLRQRADQQGSSRRVTR